MGLIAQVWAYLVDTINATLELIKGTGFTTTEDSLHSIRIAINSIDPGGSGSVDVGSVNGIVVTSPDDFKANTSGLATQVTVDAIKLSTDNLPSDPADQSLVESAISTTESNIRGSDSDDLKTISDQIDTLDRTGRTITTTSTGSVADGIVITTPGVADTFSSWTVYDSGLMQDSYIDSLSIKCDTTAFGCLQVGVSDVSVMELSVNGHIGSTQSIPIKDSYAFTSGSVISLRASSKASGNVCRITINWGIEI